MRLLGPSRSAVHKSLVWLLGSPRSGTTWLAGMMAEHPRVKSVNEPLIGMHIGVFFEQIISVPTRSGQDIGARVIDLSAERDAYFFARRFRDVWEPPLRRLLLDRFRAQMSADGMRPGRDILVVKEPHGAEGADVISAALPQSRLLVLLRDGRDVVDSELDAISPGAWGATTLELADLDDRERLRLVEQQSQRWVARVQVARAAYDAHDASRRLLLRYEDLLADTAGQLRRIYEWLGLAPPDLASIVARGTFDALPAERRGPGKFARAATPGLWRQNLRPAEQQAAIRIMAEQLVAAGYPVD